jgi:hypothetical protein
MRVLRTEGISFSHIYMRFICDDQRESDAGRDSKLFKLTPGDGRAPGQDYKTGFGASEKCGSWMYALRAHICAHYKQFLFL